MERKIQEPFKLPVHPKLLDEINDMSIRIKVWHLIKASHSNTVSLDELQLRHTKPTYEEIENLLMRCYQVINQQREDPRKY